MVYYRMLTLSQAYEAVKGHDEIAIKEIDGRVVFDYILIFPGTFNATREEITNRAYDLWESAGRPEGDGVDFWLQAEKDCKQWALHRRQFRGITFDAATGEVLSLPLHKFFNVNQVAETQFDLLKHKKATIYEKLDGSMIHFFMHNGELTAATCRSHETPQAQLALRTAIKNEDLKNQIVSSINDGWTPIFELVAPSNQIVVAYPRKRLVYLISRNRSTGKYKFQTEFADRASQYDFVFGNVFSEVETLEEFEGYVCHLTGDDGEVEMIVKVKTPWYIERHKAVSALMRPAYRLYQIVFDGLMDDLIAIATEPYKPTLNQIYEEAQRDLLSEKLKVEQEFSTILELHKQQLALTTETNPLKEFEKEVADLVKTKDRISVIKHVREFTGLGLGESKRYVETGVWPESLIRKNELEMEERRKLNIKTTFVELVKSTYPDDLHFIVDLYQGNDPDEGLKQKLMEIYRAKYPHKLFADLEDDDG